MLKISKKYALFYSAVGIFFSNYGLSFGANPDTAQAREFYNYAYVLLEKAQFDSSMYYFETAGALWQKVDAHRNYLKCRIGIIENYIRQRDAKSALALLEKAEKFAEAKIGTSYEEVGRIQTLTGYIYVINEEYDQAITNTLKGISTYKTVLGEENIKVASAYYTLGLGWYGKGEYDRAIETFDKAKRIQINLKGESNLALSNTYTMLGLVYDIKNEFEKAIECYDQSLVILTHSNKLNTSGAASTHLNMMSSLNNKGDYFQAIEHGKKTIEIYSALSLPEHPNVASAYEKLGEIHATIGDLEKAKEYLERSLQIFSSRYPEKKSAIGKLYHRLSDIYKSIGDLDKARLYCDKGVSIFEQAFGGLHPEIGFLYEQLAGIYTEQRNAAEALKYYRKAIAARERVGETTSHSDIAALYSSMGDVYIRCYNVPASVGHLNKVSYKVYVIDSVFAYLTLASKTFEQSSQRNIPQEALLLQRYGDAYTLQKDYHRALGEYQKAVNLLANNAVINNSELPSFEQSIYKKELLDVVLQKAAVFEKLYSAKKSDDDLKTALYHYGRAIDLVDGIRKQFSYDGSKFYLAEKSASVYGNACRVALKLHKATGEARYNEAAFLIADRSKANVLLEKLFDGEAKQFAGIPDSLLQQEKLLLKDIAFYETKIQNENAASVFTIEEKQVASNPIHESKRNSNSSQAVIFDLKAKHEQLIDVFEHQYPKYYELKYAQYSVTLTDIQRKLAPHTALVEYLVDKEAIYAFCLTKDNLIVKTVQNTEKIEAQVERLSSSLRKYDNDGYLSSGRALYASLLEPLTKSLSSVSALIIIPDGNLSYVPFEVLISRSSGKSSKAKKSAPDFTSLPYLISKYDISYSYSAAFYIKMYSDKGDFVSDHPTVYPLEREGGGSFAGFAPVFRDSTKNGDFLANRSYVEESGISDVRSITLDGKTFNELKYSEEEVVSIGNTFNNRSLPYRNFLHTSATESNFKQYASTYDILHVATHGFINESNSKLSAILFSQPLVPDAQDDGILHVNETFNLDLRAKLVVLSSCESGIGKLVKGEGMIALTRGLFYAGAKNIIFSLWKVSDKQTYLLMDEFYKHMLAGGSYSSSLRAAKLKMIASKESAFPSKWSGFVLVGE